MNKMNGVCTDGNDPPGIHSHTHTQTLLTRSLSSNQPLARVSRTRTSATLPHCHERATWSMLQLQRKRMALSLIQPIWHWLSTVEFNLHSFYIAHDSWVVLWLICEPRILVDLYRPIQRMTTANTIKDILWPVVVSSMSFRLQWKANDSHSCLPNIYTVLIVQCTGTLYGMVLNDWKLQR